MALSTTYQCLRLPASGASVERVPYTTVKNSAFPKGDDAAFDIIADLRPYWTGDYKDRLIQRFMVPSHPLPMLNGEFIIYYSTNADKPANRTLLNMPAVRDAVERSTRTGVSFEDRLFYRGDVFVVRLSQIWEDANFKTNFEDIRVEMVAPVLEMLGERLFARNWEAGFLEIQKRNNAYFDRNTERYRSIKEKLLAAMPPEQRENKEAQDMAELLAVLTYRGGNEE